MIHPKELFREAVLSGVLIGGAMDLIFDQRQITVGIKNIFVDSGGNFHILTSWTGEITCGMLQESDPTDIYISYIFLRGNSIADAEQASNNRWQIVVAGANRPFFQPPYKSKALTVESIKGF